MHQTDKKQIIEYLKIVGFTQPFNGEAGEFNSYYYSLSDDVFCIIEVIWDETDFKRRITTEIRGYESILTYLKINFKIDEH